MLTEQRHPSSEKIAERERQWSIRSILFTTTVIAIQIGLFVNNPPLAALFFMCVAPAGTMRLLRHGMGLSNERLVRFARHFSLGICVGLPFLGYLFLVIADATMFGWFGLYFVIVGVSAVLLSVAYFYWIVFTYEMLSLDFWGMGDASKNGPGQ